MHLNQSLKTDGRYPNSAPDFGGAIEVDNEGNVNGWDYLWVRYADKVARGRARRRIICNERKSNYE